MKLIRILTLAVAVPALFIPACSRTPQELQAPVNPQFGTSYTDSATAVSTNAAHGDIYVAGTTERDSYGNDNVFLRRYQRNGSLVWERRSDFKRARAQAAATETDAAGNVYLGWNTDPVFDPWDPANPDRESAFISKLNRSGDLLWRIEYATGGVEDLVADMAGNIYVVGAIYTIMDAAPDEYDRFIHKYDPDGQLVWETSWHYYDFGGDYYTVSALTLADDGFLYAVGNRSSGSNDSVLLQLTSTDGTLTRVQTLPESLRSWNTDVVASGTDVYVMLGQTNPSGNPINLLKYNSAGSLLWQRTIRPFGQAAISGISVDAQGALYLAGQTDPDGDGEYDYVVRKYTASGAIAWTTSQVLPRTNEYGEAVATLGTNEVYVVGSTDTTVNGINHGDFDAFLIGLNRQGQPVWSR